MSERNIMKNIILTATNIGCLTTCMRKFYLCYELGWRKKETSEALRFGTAFHAGLEELELEKPVEEAVKAAIGTAGDAPFDEETAAKLTALLSGYHARYRNDAGVDYDIKEVKPEEEFLIRFARGVYLAGKLDGRIVTRLGKRGILEHKTTSEDISWGSDYWENINRNQIALYGIAYEIATGCRPEVYLYDVIRKPSIKQTAKDGSAEGYMKRLYDDCRDVRPDWYFARREIDILDCDRMVLEDTIKVLVKVVRWHRREAKRLVNPLLAWPKCGSTMVCRMCPYRGVCDLTETPEAFESGVRFTELTKVQAVCK